MTHFRKGHRDERKYKKDGKTLRWGTDPFPKREPGKRKKKKKKRGLL
jgi:hypothetical protein